MTITAAFKLSIWTISIATFLAALSVWLQDRSLVSLYSLFPLFGLTAFGLMWTHYISDALQRYLSLPEYILSRHFKITSYIVLFCILIHPGLFELQLYLDGLGLPPQSLFLAYPVFVERLAIIAGITAFTCFILFELYRFFKDRPWWKYVEWANIAAMALILWHGWTLGVELRTPWFQALWIFYAVTFAVAVLYTSYDKRRTSYGS